MKEDIYLKRVFELAQQRRLVLFIGSDLPADTTGHPSRAELARKLAISRQLPESLSLAQTAQRVSHAGNRYEFTAFLRSELDTVGNVTPLLFQKIVEFIQSFQINGMITTAYANMLELAFRQAGVPINRIVSDQDVSFIDPQRPTLIRLYGDLQQPDSLIVTEDDHYALMRNRDKENLLDEVRSMLRRNSVLFLGYNLADPDFNLLWRELLERMGQFQFGAFAAWPDMPQGEVDIWRDRNIMVLNQEASVLLSYLASGELPPKQTSSVQVPQREGTVSTPSMNVFVNGDFIIGNKAEGDIIGADKTTIETVSDSVIAVGQSSSASGELSTTDPNQSEDNRDQDRAAFELQQQLLSEFDFEGLQSLCTRLKVNWEELEGEDISVKAQNLVLYMQRSGQLDRLRAVI